MHFLLIFVVGSCINFVIALSVFFLFIVSIGEKGFEGGEESFCLWILHVGVLAAGQPGGQAVYGPRGPGRCLGGILISPNLTCLIYLGQWGWICPFMSQWWHIACNLTHLSNGSFFIAAIALACSISTLSIDFAKNDKVVVEAMMLAHNFPPTKSR
jgi:hypothetical protein